MMQSIVNGIDSAKRFKLTCCAEHAGPLARITLETAQLLDATSGYDGIDDRGLGAPKRGSTRFAAVLESSGQDLV